MEERSAFAGGDQDYLRDVQYRNGEKLDARAFLHRTYSTASVAFARFEADLVDWHRAHTVLECGSGTGRFWEGHPGPTAMRATLTDLSPGMVAEARQGNGERLHIRTGSGVRCAIAAVRRGAAERQFGKRGVSPLRTVRAASASGCC